MTKIDEYRECAAECLRIAEDAQFTRDRAPLIAMADRWNKLADKVLSRKLRKLALSEYRNSQKPLSS